MSDSNPSAVPLSELLRHIPTDTRISVITSWLSDGSPNCTHSIPVGRHARDAADRIEALEAETAALREELIIRTNERDRAEDAVDAMYARACGATDVSSEGKENG